MTTFPPGCYCLNPNCQHPENPRDLLQCQSCGKNLLLQNRYRAVQLIGQGGFGRTFRAVDESEPSQPYCAIKQFFPQQQGTNNTQKAAELFRLEATRLEELGNHPQIPHLFAHIEQDDGLYLVQEFIAGQNLAQELAEKGHFDETEIRKLLNTILPLLQFVHSQQMIHRDIKPENIIRRTRPQSPPHQEDTPPQTGGEKDLVLVDFGAAKYATETILGKTGTVIGSAAYTAPEQTKGKATFASDIYSLGVTCVHLLTQIPPFDLFDTSENTWVWRQYLKQPVSKELGKILDKMLESATNWRYQSAQEVLKDLNSPVAAKFNKKKWLVASVMLVLGFAGIRHLTTPPPEPVYEMAQSIAIPNQPGLNTIVNGKHQVFPLQHTEVMAKISGNVSRVEVTQTFANRFKDPLEAIYVFPLPDGAAVDDMEIKVGDRIIRGVIKKREEAKKIYQQAKQQGKTAGLLEQERDNIFTQSLANIKPGEKIDVTIRYTESLKFEKGDYEFAFPMAVGQRYIPGGNRVPDAARINPLMARIGGGQKIGVTVEIEAGVAVNNVRSPSHEIRTTQDGRILRVQLANQNEIPNKDLILRYQVAGKETQSTVLTQADERGGHFATYFIPAVEYQSNQIVPKDVVFLMDTSGSQKGAPIRQSQELMRRFINGLNPDDTFTIIDFADTAQQLSPYSLANTPGNRNKAIAYINRLDANGGSELINGIDEVLNFPPADEGRLRSIVLITDGLMGNDNEILAEVQRKLKPGNRLYSFGVGSNVNRFLVNRLAELGRGTAEILSYNDPAQKVVEKFFQNMNNPVLTNIEVKWQGSGKAPEIYPERIPDLFANQPMVVYGRKSDRSSGTLRIRGIAAGGKFYEKTIPVNFGVAAGSASPPQGNEAIAQLWGRARIKDLTARMFKGENAKGVQDVTDTALAYRLLSKYTAFVAVTEEVRVDPQGKKLQVQVPVAKPDVTGNKKTAQTTVKTTVNSPRFFDFGRMVSTPEPSAVAGNSLAVLLLWKFVARKRARKPGV